MAITWRTTAAWDPAVVGNVTGKGSPLTGTERDATISALLNRIYTLENSPPVAVSIASITQSGATVTITLTDASTVTLDLPDVLWDYKGTWQPIFTYLKGDAFTVPGGFYWVNVSHVSAATFDPAATDGSGTDLYRLILKSPVTPSQVKADATVTLSAADANTIMYFTNAAGCVVTIPAGVFTKDDELSFRQNTDNPVVVQPAAGAGYIEPTKGFSTITRDRGSVVTAKCADVASNLWYMFGRLADGSELTPGVVASDDAFFVPIVSSSDTLTPSLVADADAFFSPTVS